MTTLPSSSQQDQHEKNETCWYCGKEPADPNLTMKFTFHTDIRITKNINGLLYGTWRYTSVKVPQCAKCREQFNKQGTRLLLTLFLITCILTALFFLIIPFPDDFELWLRIVLSFLPGFLCAAVISVIVLSYTGKDERTAEGKRTLNRDDDYPPVKTLLESGWKKGPKPAGIVWDDSAGEEPSYFR